MALQECDTRGYLRADKAGVVEAVRRCVWHGVATKIGKTRFDVGDKAPVLQNQLVPRHFRWFADAKPAREGSVVDAIVNARSWETLKALALEHLGLDIKEIAGQFDETKQKLLRKYRKATS